MERATRAECQKECGEAAPLHVQPTSPMKM
jgi:hypothetical protein